jgi:polar amino acid transport system substrate-binding protein
VADPYPPYQFEEGGRLRGIDLETIREAFAARGLEAGATLLPWSQCLEWMRERKAHGIFQIAPNPEREKLYLFSAQLRTERTALLQRAGGSLAIGDPAGIEEALAGRTLGILSGYSYDARIHGLPSSLKIELESQEALLRALAEGRVEAILMDLGVAAYLTRRLGLEPAERVEGFELRRTLHVAFQPAEAELARLFNAGLQDIRGRGKDRRIFERYGVSA